MHILAFGFTHLLSCVTKRRMPVALCVAGLLNTLAITRAEEQTVTVGPWTIATASKAHCLPPQITSALETIGHFKKALDSGSKVTGKANRWQYETISMSRTTEIVALNAMLNGLGKQGGELVSAIPEDDATFLIFKRAGG